MPDLPLALIDQPIGGEALNVIHARADHALPHVIRALTTADSPRGAAGSSGAYTGVLTFASDDEVMEAFHGRRWTDGLPFVLPTPERVQTMIAGSGRAGCEVIGVVPPRWRGATVQETAGNAVTAGCLPQPM